MIRWLRSWGVRCVAAASVAAFAGAAHADLQINEIVAGPARDWDASGDFSSRDDEWVELKNPDGSPIVLTGYLVTDADRLPRFAPEGTLGAGERLQVFGRTAYDWERGHGFPAFGLSLGNSGDTVMLWHVTGADTVLVDSYAYKSHEAAADRSVGRLSDTGAWTLFDGLNPYTGATLPVGTGCTPTPGLANDCAATPARPTSWGRLKTLYR